MHRSTPGRELIRWAFVLLYMLASNSLSLAKDPPKPRLLANIDVANFGSEQLRIGDLDGDGGPDLLLAQSNFANRDVTCLTALTIEGKVLWQMGTPSLENGRIYSDLPVQIYDWDNDGQNEVLYIRQAKYLEPWNLIGKPPFSIRQRAGRYEGNATMMILDGKTGVEKSKLAIPAAADDCFLFADLTGRGRREDLVVKDRYWNAWGIAHDGRELWHWTGSTGHFPVVFDVNGDGKDETFFGYTLVDHAGKVLFSHDPNRTWKERYTSLPTNPTRADYARYFSTPLHSDAEYIVRLASGELRLLYGNTGLHCLAADGTELWQDKRIGEAQHVVVGHFRKDSPYQAVVIDRTPSRELRKTKPNEAFANLYLFDLEGKELWKQQQAPGDWVVGCTSLDWFGKGSLESILVYGYREGRPAQLLSGDGKVVAEFPMHYRPDRRAEEPEAWRDPLGVIMYYPLCADVWGDSREEVILFGARGLCIYTNPAAFSLPSQYNETLYPGM
jgi:hypothetical protein